MNEQDDLGTGLGEPPREVVRMRRLSPGVGKRLDPAAERRGERSPALAELAARNDEHRLARREQIDERGLERAGTGRGQDEHLVLGAEDLLQAAVRAAQRP